jgi:putative phosphoesterase
MKIAITSDVHDNLSMLRKALEYCQQAEALICCGDLCSPFVIKEFGQGFAKPVHIVFGNNDGDRFRIASAAAQFSQVHLHGEYVELDLDGKTFAVNHFDTIGRAIAKGEKYDVVCFGHNHRFESTPVGRTLLVNPGEIYGGLSGHSTFAVYDTGTGDVERIEL